MRYQSMDSSKAKRFIQLRREGQEPALDGFVDTKGSGPEYPIDLVQKLRAELLAIRLKYPAELKEKDRNGGRFEAEACEKVHQILPFDAQVFADSGFWVWLAVTQLSEIVEWRHGGTDRWAKLLNYGIGNRTENLVFRMWLRADLVFDQAAEDPYWLAKRGDQDLWRSHVFRQDYTNVREFARALVNFQCLPEGYRLHPSNENGMRVLAKRIKRLRANIVFEFLSTSQLTDLLTQQSAGLEAAGNAK
ncbi:MAG: hypothetical protein FIB06_03610 [Betaproteobacteria bacterium]|nr:hypothetical protein [Betaproteobacteria bacterium]